MKITFVQSAEEKAESDRVILAGLSLRKAKVGTWILPPGLSEGNEFTVVDSRPEGRDVFVESFETRSTARSSTRWGTARARCGHRSPQGRRRCSMPIAGMNVDTGQKTWLTPPDIIGALGPFDMDPCVPDSMPWRTAARMVTETEDGLAVPWEETVWLNPPYGRESVPFLRKMSLHRNGVALLFGRTDTKAWHEFVFPVADSILFMRGRLSFYREDGTQAGTANAPSALVAYTPHFTAKLMDSGIPGYVCRCSGRRGVSERTEVRP